MIGEALLSEILLAALPEPAREKLGARPDLEAVVARVYGIARSAWPDISLDAGAFLPFLAARIGRSDDPGKTLEEVRVGDLYLLCAYTRGDARAAALLESRYLSRLDGILRKQGQSDQIADLKQLFFERLLAEGTERFQYAGRGDLMGWLAVAAVREARQRAKREGRFEPIQRDLLEGMTLGEDLELEYMKREYRDHFRAALREAIQSLSSRERNVLRYHFVKGIPLEDIGRIYGAHRATIARWIASARADVLKRTRLALMERLRLSGNDLDQLMELIRSRIGASILSFLRTGTAGPIEPEG